MTRQRRRNASLAVCGMVLLGALGCQQVSNQVERDREAAAQRLRRAPLTGDSLRVALITTARDRGIDSATAFALASAGTVKLGLASPLVDDEQAFEANAGGYKADVLAFPMDDLEKYHSVNDFSTAHNVALLQVATAVGSSPEPGYKPLKLGAAGFYCVYLVHAGSNDYTGWNANVSPVATPADCNATVPSTAFDVAAEAEGDEFTGHWDDYNQTPPSVRFVEGKNKAMFLGVRCGNRTCVVGTSSPGVIKIPDHGPAHVAQTDIRLWHDEQALSDMATNPKPKMLAALIPDANLGNLDLKALQSGFQPVARVEIKGSVLPTYSSAYHFSSATSNDIFIKLDQPDPLTGLVTSGTAMIRNDLGSFFFRVKRMDHKNVTATLPATARWKWTLNDEEIWVRCDIGCCMVEPGIS